MAMNISFLLAKMRAYLMNVTWANLVFAWNDFYSSRPGEWGDHVTLQAAADRVSTIFFLFSLFTYFDIFYINNLMLCT